MTPRHRSNITPASPPLCASTLTVPQPAWHLAWAGSSHQLPPLPRNDHKYPATRNDVGEQIVELSRAKPELIRGLIHVHRERALGDCRAIDSETASPRSRSR